MSNLPFVVRLIPRADYEREKSAGRGLMGLREFAPQDGTPFGMLRHPLQSPIGLPCVAPPWGTLAAVSLDSGDVLWQVPLGSVPDQLRLPIPVTIGLPNLGGPLVTDGGLAFISASMDGNLRAFDIENRRRTVARPAARRRQRQPDDVSPVGERPASTW